MGGLVPLQRELAVPRVGSWALSLRRELWGQGQSCCSMIWKVPRKVPRKVLEVSFRLLPVLVRSLYERNHVVSVCHVIAMYCTVEPLYIGLYTTRLPESVRLTTDANEIELYFYLFLGQAYNEMKLACRGSVLSGIRGLSLEAGCGGGFRQREGCCGAHACVGVFGAVDHHRDQHLH